MDPDRPSAAADAVQRACREVADALAAADDRLMPSVYLERGGRLRCQVAHGYRQVLDGMLPSTGVIGETFRTGIPHRIADVRDEPAYLAAALGVVAEICLPLRHHGRIVGALNCESRQPMTSEQFAAIEAGAADLERRIEALGGVPGESAAQRLARAAAQFSALSDPGRIAEVAVDAALELTGMDSAILVDVRARAGAGPLGPVLLSLPMEELQQLTAPGSSFYTVSAWGEEFGELALVYEAGARAVAAVRLSRRDDVHGILLVADTGRDMLSTQQVERLELLAAHASSALQTAEDIAELRRRAATDSLTGLGHHANFNERLADVRVAPSRVAVLIVDVDGFKAINDTAGHQAGDIALRTVAARLAGAVRQGDEVFRIGGDEFAAIVQVRDEQEALGIGHRLREAVAEGGVTVSVGVALPREGESDAALLARADRALYDVKSSGRDGVLLSA